MKVKAIFLDKDGTLIPDIPYNVNTDLIMLNEGAAEGLHLLQSNGYMLIIISNQDGIAKGYFTESELDKVKIRLTSLFSATGICLDGFYYCPHHPDAVISQYRSDCDCRKPGPGLLTRAAKEMNIDLFNSWMIGDILNDVEAGNRAGCRSILINNGNETEWNMSRERTPVFKARDLAEAAMYILNAA